MTAEQRSRAIWALAAGAIFVAYALTWCTSYCAPNNGNELFVMSEFSLGRMPYRDYYWVQPPGMPLAFGIFEKLFGARMLPFFAFSLVARGAATSLLAYTLSVRRNTIVCSLASAVAVILSCNDDGESISHYTHWCSTWTVVMLAAVYPWVVDSDPAPRWRAVVAGVSAGMLFIVKQTTAVQLFLFAVAIVGIAIVDPSSRRRIRQLFLLATAGFAIPLVISFGWVAIAGGFSKLILYAYMAGPSSKGSPVDSAMRIFTGPFEVGVLGLAAKIALAIGALVCAWLYGRKRLGDSPRAGALDGVFVAVAVLTALYFGSVAATVFAVVPAVVRSSIYAAIFGSLGYAVLGLRAVDRSPSDADARHRYVLATACLAHAYAMSGSWGAMEFMTFPGLAVVAVELMHDFEGTALRTHARATCVALAIFWLLPSSWWRYTSPYRWSYWYESPVAAAEYRSKQPGLWGFTMGESTAEFLDAVTDITQRASDPDESMVAFPHLLMLPALAGRRTFGTVPMLFFDVCPDAYAEKEAQRLLTDPPPVIVYQDLPPAVVAEQEQLWRGGGKSGQRAVLESIHRLVSSGRFRDVARFTRNGPIPIRVLIRADRIGRLGLKENAKPASTPASASASTPASASASTPAPSP